MADGYRAIVIGGGVAGASIAYHLTELGWQDVLLVDRGELTSGSTFHSAGLVGQLRSSVSLTRMMMYGAELYRRLAAETGVDPGWHEVGSLRLASTDERMQELRRQEGWAHTFGLPLEVISTDDALARFPLFDPSGVQGAAFIPTDGHLDPTNLTLALAEGARQARRRDPDEHAGDGDRRRRRPRARRAHGRTRSDRGRRRRERRRDVREPDRPAGRRGGARRAVRAPVPVDQARSRRKRGPADDARPGPARVLPRRGRRRPGHGGLRTQPRHVGGGRRPTGRLQPSAPARRLGAVRVARRERVRARSGAPDRRGRDDDQRPGGVHTGRRVHPGRVRSPRVLRGRRVLRARDRRRRRRRQGHGRLDRARRARVRRVEDGHPPVRLALPLAPLCPGACVRGLRHLLRHPLPRRRAASGPPAQDRADVRPTGEARRGVRREIRLGARQLVRRERGSGVRGTAPARMGRRALVERDRGGAHGHARARRPLRRVELREDRRERSRRDGLPPTSRRPTMSIAPRAP